MGTKNSCKTAAVMGLLGRGPAAEAAPPVSVERPRDIEAITSEILDAKRAGGEAILTIGKGLMEAKAVLPHGEWLPWLEEKVEFSERVAQNFMRLARHYSNPNTVSDLGASKALMMLALPDKDRDEFISMPHIVDGEEKNVSEMTRKELQTVLKERDEALKAAEQAKADQSAAEQAREKIFQDMALANERIAGLNAQVKEQSAKAREAQDAADRLEKELEELRSRPVEVAVEADAAAIEAARRDAEEKTRTQVEKELKTERKTMQEQVLQANRSEAQVKTELEQVKRELADLRFEAERMEKKAALTSSEDLVLFRALFDQAQELANKMGGVLMKVRGKDPEKAAGLSKALLALCDKIRGVAAQ